jgi:hypothetical protein
VARRGDLLVTGDIQLDQEIADIRKRLIAGADVLSKTDWDRFSAADLDDEGRMVRPAVDTLVEIVGRDAWFWDALNLVDVQGLIAACADIGSAVGGPVRLASGTSKQDVQIHIKDNLQSGLAELRPYRFVTDPVPLRTGLAWIDRCRQSIEEDRDAARGIRSDAKRIVGETNDALKAAREAVALQAVATQGAHFSDAAEAYREDATFWGRCATVLGGIIIGAGIVFITCGHGPPLPKESWLAASNLSYFGARLLIVSVVSFGLVVTVKNYRAARHNVVMNEHRARALRTFEQFRNAAPEGKVQDAILLHASEAVFSVQSSGFSEAALGGTHVAEVISAMSPSK